MLTYENADLAPIRSVMRELAAGGTALSRIGQDGIVHIRAAEFDTVGRTTLSLYARRHGVAHTYIVETPMRLDMAARVNAHRLVLDRLFAGMGY